MSKARRYLLALVAAIVGSIGLLASPASANYVVHHGIVGVAPYQIYEIHSYVFEPADLSALNFEYVTAVAWAGAPGTQYNVRVRCNTSYPDFQGYDVFYGWHTQPPNNQGPIAEVSCLLGSIVQSVNIMTA